MFKFLRKLFSPGADESEAKDDKVVEPTPDNSSVQDQMLEEQQEVVQDGVETDVLDEAAKQGDNPAAELADQLQALTAGLTYISESDSEFTGEVMEGELGAEGAASEQELRAGMDLAPEKALTILDADTFWSYYTDASIHGAETAKRFADLRATLEDKLEGVQFVKVDGDEDWQKFIYLVGRADTGDLVGLKAESVET